MTSDEPQWLRWAKQLQAHAQIGLAYTKDPYDAERFESIRRIAMEMMAVGSETPMNKVEALFAQETGYATPKVDVRGVVFHENKLLFVRERQEQVWTLPGGWADVLEAPREGVEREVFEESGYEVRATKLLAVFDRNKHPHKPLLPHHMYKLFIRCELTGGAPSTSYETDAAGFFAENEIPRPLSISRVTEGQIHRLFEHYRNPRLETDFD